MLSPILWASLCSLALSRRVPELASLFCLISFCFEQIGQQRATVPLQGLVLVAGAQQWLQVNPEGPEGERDRLELHAVASDSFLECSKLEHSQPSLFVSCLYL